MGYPAATSYFSSFKRIKKFPREVSLNTGWMAA
jgi:hypothetical protein